MTMTFRDQCMEAWIQRLMPQTQVYARAYWAHLTTQGPQPDPKRYGIGDKDKAIRVRLAGAR
jgi:hypothetical protein